MITVTLHWVVWLCLAALLTGAVAELFKYWGRPYREFYEGVKECMQDTWECHVCGRSEPWWKDSNADYLTRGNRLNTVDSGKASP